MNDAATPSTPPAGKPRRPSLFDRGVVPLMVGADDAADLCGVGRSHWLSLNSAGKTPAPVRLGARTLWSVEALRAWIAAGCPKRGSK